MREPLYRWVYDAAGAGLSWWAALLWLLAILALFFGGPFLALWVSGQLQGRFDRKLWDAFPVSERADCHDKGEELTCAQG